MSLQQLRWPTSFRNSGPLHFGTAADIKSESVAGLRRNSHVTGYPLFLPSWAGFLIAFLAAMSMAVRAEWRAYLEKKPKVKIILGDDAPFHTYKKRIHISDHLIRIGIESTKSLSNCNLVLLRLSGEFSARCPVSIKTGLQLNSGEVVYLDFAELEESGSSVAFAGSERRYGIRVYFPINPLPSDKSNWLDNQPYTLAIQATATDSPPFTLDCRLFVENNKLKLERLKD